MATIGIYSLKTAFVNHLGNFQANKEKAKAAGIIGLSINLWDGNAEDGIGENATVGANRILMADLAFRRGLTADGFKLGAWAIPRAHPERSAEGLSTLYGTLGLSFADIEMEWEYKTNGGKVDAARFTDKWRRTRPKAYTSCVSYGFPDAAMNWKAIVEAGFHFKSECYWRLDGRFTPRDALKQWLAWGFRPELYHPLLPVTFEPTSDLAGHTLREGLVRSLDIRDISLSAKGWNMYLGENATDDDWYYAGLVKSL